MPALFQEAFPWTLTVKQPGQVLFDLVTPMVGLVVAMG